LKFIFVSVKFAKSYEIFYRTLRIKYFLVYPIKLALWLLLLVLNFTFCFCLQKFSFQMLNIIIKHDVTKYSAKSSFLHLSKSLRNCIAAYKVKSRDFGFITGEIEAELNQKDNNYTWNAFLSVLIVLLFSSDLIGVPEFRIPNTIPGYLCIQNHRHDFKRHFPLTLYNFR